MFQHVFKRNPYHDELGRFSSKDQRAAGFDSPAKAKDKTSMAAHYDKYDDPTITVTDILHAKDPATGKPLFSKEDRKEIAQALTDARRAPTSKKQHTIDPEGTVYSDKRKALHKKIIDHILSPESIAAATPAPGEKPTFIVLAGRGGSGKSSFTHTPAKDGRPEQPAKVKEFDSKKFIKLDSDEIKEWLKPPYAGWNAGSVHDEASDIFNEITHRAKAMGLNLIHDSTMRSLGVAREITEFKSLGYRIEGHMMFVPRQVSAVRAVQRYLGKGKESRGRLVPVNVILGNTNNERNFDTLKSQFDAWSAYDNQGAAPVLIARHKKGAKK